VDTIGPGLPERIGPPAVPEESGTAAINALLDDRASLRKLVELSLWHLGSGMSNKDAEDALQDFCIYRRQRVIDTYKPGAQSLIDYFMLCLKRFCWKRGKKLRRNKHKAKMLAHELNVIREHQDSSPVQKMLTEDKERKRDTQRSRLREAMSQLPPCDQLLLLLHHVEERPIREIAARHLGISESAVKVRIHRLRRRLAALLEGES
jgi:RNA polymerase sigma factor (sigma-70 family)